MFNKTICRKLFLLYNKLESIVEGEWALLKNDILSILKANKDKHISGQELCEMLNVSRTAVWKCINELKSDGYIIESKHKSGYLLMEEPDIIDYMEISPYLKTKFIGRNYLHFESISSTNDYAKEIAPSAADGTAIVAEEQTSGRGRMGRHWVSNKGQGIWLSIILKPNLSPNEAVKLTQVAAVSVIETIKEIADIRSGIKWPNDIVINSKKVCGILTEMNGEIDRVNFIVIGIGVNVNVQNFPEDLCGKATSLSIETGKILDRKPLTASILNNFEKYYRIFLINGFSSIRNLCKEYSLTLNKDVKVIINNNECIGRAVDIDDDGNLIVVFKNGEKKTIASGDVSVRGLLGYV